MSATSNVGPAWSIDERLTTADCEAMLRRVCFGHILLARGGHVDVLPIRYAFREGWLLRDRGTGSATGEAAALRGILELRDPTTVVAGRGSRNRRTSTVFRLHADEMRGLVVFVPRPRAEREHDAQDSPRAVARVAVHACEWLVTNLDQEVSC
jgi:hypothetical protein